MSDTVPNNDSQKTNLEPLNSQNIHSDLDPIDIRLNFNALLYLFTELIAIFNQLVLTMKEKETITDAEIKKIYEITTEKDVLTRTYTPVFNRFMEYYIATKKDVTGKEPETFVNPNETVVPNTNTTVPPVEDTLPEQPTTIVETPSTITS